MGRIECHLFGLGEVVVRVAVEHHLADRGDRHLLLGDELGRVENIEVELVLVLFLHDLNPELEFQKVAVLDIVPHVATIEVRIPAPQLLRFVPDQRTGAGQRLPVELDEA